MRLLKDTAFTAVISPQARRGTGMGTTGQAGTAQGIPPILCCQAGLHPSRTSGIHLSCEMLRMILSSSRPFSLGQLRARPPRAPDRQGGRPEEAGRSFTASTRRSWALQDCQARPQPLLSASFPGLPPPQKFSGVPGREPVALACDSVWL